MTWEIALGIFALAGFVISLITIAAKIISTLTKLETTIQNLQKTVDEFKASNEKASLKSGIRWTNTTKSSQNTIKKLLYLKKERDIMDFGFTAFPAIAVICYLVAEIVKCTPLDNKYLPIIAGSAGGSYSLK